jgi:hypothetical protein
MQIWSVWSTEVGHPRGCQWITRRKDESELSWKKSTHDTRRLFRYAFVRTILRLLCAVCKDWQKRLAPHRNMEVIRNPIIPQYSTHLREGINISDDEGLSISGPGRNRRFALFNHVKSFYDWRTRKILLLVPYLQRKTTCPGVDNNIFFIS